MGASIGAALRRAGVEVLWVSAGRGPGHQAPRAFRGLDRCGHAVRAGRPERPGAERLPPHAAIRVARTVAASEFAGTDVDANAVAPPTARALGAVVERAGGQFVDGDLIGGPVRRAAPPGYICPAPPPGEIAALLAPPSWRRSRSGTTSPPPRR
jgi:hypothetical protein